MLSSSKWVIFFEFSSWTKLYMHLYSLPCVLYIPRNSSPLNTWGALQIIRLLIMQSYPMSCTYSLTGPVLSLAPCFYIPLPLYFTPTQKTREMCNIMYCCSTYCVFSDATCPTYCACSFYFTHITWTVKLLVTSEQFQQCSYCHLLTYSYIHLHVWDSIKPCKHLFWVCTFSCLLHASMLCCYLGPAEFKLTNAGPITE